MRAARPSGRGSSRPIAHVVGALGERPLEPGREEVDRDGRGRGGPFETPLLGGSEHVPPRRDELVEERRELAGRLHLDPLPEPDLRLVERLRASSRWRGTPSSRPAIASSRSASGAWSRANSRNSPSPIVSSASERRSQTRSSSASKIDRRMLWTSRSRSNRTAADRPASSSASIVARCCAVGGDLAQDRLPAAVPELVVVGVDAEVRRRDRVVAHQPAEARLDEVVERDRRAGHDRATGAGRGRAGPAVSGERVKRDAPGYGIGRRRETGPGSGFAASVRPSRRSARRIRPPTLRVPSRPAPRASP